MTRVSHWIANIVFQRELITGRFRLIGLWVLDHLSKKSEVTQSLLQNRFGREEAELLVAELVSSNIIQLKSTEGSDHVYELTEVGRGIVQSMRKRSKKCIHDTAVWLGQQLGYTIPASERETRTFFESIYDWTDQSSERFINVLKGSRLSTTLQSREATARTENGPESIVEKIRSGEITDPVVTQLMVHSFVWWVMRRALEGERETVMIPSPRDVDLRVIIDTNVLIGALVECDVWHNLTSEMFLRIKKWSASQKGKLTLILLEPNMEELLHAFRRIGNVVEGLRVQSDRTTFENELGLILRRPVFVDFLSRQFPHIGGFEAYQHALLLQLGKMAREHGLQVVEKRRLHYEDSTWQKQIEVLWKLEERSRQHPSNERIETKLTLLRYAEEVEKSGAIPLIWSYHKKLPAYELALYGQQRFTFSYFLLMTMLDPAAGPTMMELDHIWDIVKHYVASSDLQERYETLIQKARYLYEPTFRERVSTLGEGVIGGQNILRDLEALAERRSTERRAQVSSDDDLDDIFAGSGPPKPVNQDIQ